MADPSPDPFVGQQVANFRVDELLKVGSLSRIYRGWDVIQRRPVAVKVIDARQQPDKTYAERFLREARRMMSAWWHRHITRIYYAAKQDGRYIIVMEYVDGPNLKELLATYTDEDELIPVDDVIRIGRAVAEALEYAHQHGVIHRDVKPSNVLVSVDGRVLLTDFGLVRPVEQEGDLEDFGTAAYIAPEQVGNPDEIDKKADLYSLAAMVYEMLVGQPPFPEPADVSGVRQRMSAKPPVPSSVNPYLDHWVDAVLLKALSRSPEKRYQSAGELMDALEGSLGASMEALTTEGELPPLPAITQKGEELGPSVSQVSVVDKIASQLEGSERAATKERQKLLTGRARRRLGCWGIFLLLMAGLIIGGGNIIFGFVLNGSEPTPIGVVMATETVTPTETAVPSPTPAATTVIVIVTAVPPTATATPIPTESPLPSPTVTTTPTTPPSTPTLTPTPPFTGPAVRFFYGRYSFYMLNPSSAPLATGAVAFQALDEGLQPTGQDFRGRDWSAIHPSLSVGQCAAIELMDAPGWLRPDECDSLNVILTPPINYANAFWIPDAGIISFRVFWNGRDIGTCPVVSGVCQLRLP